MSQVDLSVVDDNFISSLYIPLKIPTQLSKLLKDESNEMKFGEIYYLFPSLERLQASDIRFRDMLFTQEELRKLFVSMKQTMRSHRLPGDSITAEHRQIIDAIKTRCAFELLLFKILEEKIVSDSFDDTTMQDIWTMVDKGLHHTFVYSFACQSYDELIKVKCAMIMKRMEKLHVKKQEWNQLSSLDLETPNYIKRAKDDAVTKYAVSASTQASTSKSNPIGDLSKLPRSTLMRKTVKELTKYLDSKGIPTVNKDDGKILKKELLVEAILSS